MAAFSKACVQASYETGFTFGATPFPVRYVSDQPQWFDPIILPESFITPEMLSKMEPFWNSMWQYRDRITWPILAGINHNKDYEIPEGASYGKGDYADFIIGAGEIPQNQWYFPYKQQYQNTISYQLQGTAHIQNVQDYSVFAATNQQAYVTYAETIVRMFMHYMDTSILPKYLTDEMVPARKFFGNVFGYLRYVDDKIWIASYHELYQNNTGSNWIGMDEYRHTAAYPLFIHVSNFSYYPVIWRQWYSIASSNASYNFWTRSNRFIQNFNPQNQAVFWYKYNAANYSYTTASNMCTCPMFRLR